MYFGEMFIEVENRCFQTKVAIKPVGNGGEAGRDVFEVHLCSTHIFVVMYDTPFGSSINILCSKYIYFADLSNMSSYTYQSDLLDILDK